MKLDRPDYNLEEGNSLGVAVEPDKVSLNQTFLGTQFLALEKCDEDIISCGDQGTWSSWH
jgi:hypothetical protein